MVFPVVMHGCESWTVKKAEHWRIDVFELWCWRLLRVPWTARRCNQSILKEISPGCCDVKLKLQYFGHLMQRVDSLEKTLMLGGIGGRRRRDGKGWDGWMASLTWWTWVWVNSGSWWWTGRHGVLQFMGSQRVEHDWATELNWTEVLQETFRVLLSWPFFLSINLCFHVSLSLSSYSFLFIVPLAKQGKPNNSEVGSLSLLQQISPTQVLNQPILHCRQFLYQLSYEGSPFC